MPNRPRQTPVSKGFTLIELLVVITIIGIMAGVVGFNMMANDPSRDVYREAERFVLVMRQALDEATFNQYQLGLYLDDEGYRFGYWEIVEEEPEQDTSANPGLTTGSSTAPGNVNSQLNRLAPGAKPPKRVGKWRPLTSNRALRDYVLPEHILVELDVPESDLLESLTVRSESRLTKTNLNLDKIGPKIDEDPGLDPPQVYILSSGELTPFQLRMSYADDATIQAKLEADVLGRVRILPHDEL